MNEMHYIQPSAFWWEFNLFNYGQQPEQTMAAAAGAKVQLGRKMFAFKM